MKLNCDLGELQSGNDSAIMPYIDQANIACGFHASDPLTMRNTVRLAVQYDVVIGAHPSYPDKDNFGRRSMTFAAEQLIAILHYQIGALNAICQAEGTQLHYVKPHGALYNDMMADLSLFDTVCRAMAALDHPLPLMIQALPNTKVFADIAQQWKIPLIQEAFADRAYQQSGHLVPRSANNAVFHHSDQVLAQTKNLMAKQQVISIDDQPVNIAAETLCVHGDTPSAMKWIKLLRQYLDAS